MDHAHLAILFGGIALVAAACFGFLLMRRRTRYADCPHVAGTERVLYALVMQVRRDRGTHYWADREQRGIHHPDEIEAWLASLVDFGWRP